jgi:glycine betaine/proline transport system ATP-binding protein
VAVRDVSFTVEGPEIFVIMGLSGSGKSTLLRCINRLIEPSAGAVRIDDKDVTTMDKKELLQLRKERTSMVFQHFGLLSHRNVVENAAFGLELREVPEKERREKAMQTLEMVGLADYAESMVDELSGGMQQRVGLARALTTEADILLMDEAFSALDPLIRTRMQSEFLDIQEEMPKTILFITHDLGEALALGDRIAIMKDGAIVQIGTAEEIITQPAEEYVANFVENVDRSRVLTVGTAYEAAKAKLNRKATISRALDVMEEAGLPYAFVMEDGKVFGAVRKRDVELEAEKQEPELENVIMKVGPSVGPQAHIIEVLAKASGTRAPLPVLDEQGNLTGAVTKDMLLDAIAGEGEEEQ